jgi:hypothetical protein
MAQGPRAPGLDFEPALMGLDTPPESQSQPSVERDEDDPHESVTLTPPAPFVDPLQQRRTPAPGLARQSDSHFRFALDAGSRAGASLSALSRMISELTASVTSAQHESQRLIDELTALRSLLEHERGQREDQRLQIEALEAELERVRAEAAQEREFLIAQQDQFVAGLIDEHELALAETRRGLGPPGDPAEVSRLHERLARSEQAREKLEAERELSRDALLRLQAQRDDAQARAERYERERDELRAEASRLRAQLATGRSVSTLPPPPVAARTPSEPPNDLALDESELDVTLRSRPPAARHSTPPLELRAAILTPQPPHFTSRPAILTPKPPSFLPRASASLQPKAPSFSPRPPSVAPGAEAPGRETTPEPSSSVRAAAPSRGPEPRRPLSSGYSLSQPAQAEVLEGARISSKPPRKT